MSNFKENLYKKKCFIYEIDGSFYAIGQSTFSKVTDMAQIDNMELLQNAVKKNNDRQIAKYLEKIIRISTIYRVDAKEHLKLKDKLFSFIDELEKDNETEFEKLQNQVCVFDEMVEKYTNNDSKAQN